jgi:hypothetical protein
VAGTPPASASAILSERIRAIDQIKRLYAVVMGFSVTNLIGNLYSIAKSDFFDWSTELPFLLAQGLCFLSLITLFYLGAERTLETRYLRPDSRVPGRSDLLLDGIMLGSQALLFVILSNTVPALTSSIVDPRPSEIATARIGYEVMYQASFVKNVIFLRLVDSVFLSIELIRLVPASRLRPQFRRLGTQVFRLEASRDGDNLADALFVWLALNLLSILVLTVALRWQFSAVTVAGLSVNILSMILAVWHTVRFCFDFGLTFPFYYPTRPMPESEQVAALVEA